MGLLGRRHVALGVRTWRSIKMAFLKFNSVTRLRWVITIVCLLCLIVAVLSYIQANHGRSQKMAASGADPGPFVADSREHEWLVVLDGAQEVRRFRRGNDESFYVTYLLAESHPAVNAIKQISSRLQALGWKPLLEDFLNPGLPSSHVRGWTQFLDATTQPNREIQQWFAQWQDASGNIVSYTLRYSYPSKGKPDVVTLTVHGSWFSAACVKRIQAEVP